MTADEMLAACLRYSPGGNASFAMALHEAQRVMAQNVSLTFFLLDETMLM
jgi:hypothetical protein